jgi:hypothetical protein
MTARRTLVAATVVTLIGVAAGACGATKPDAPAPQRSSTTSTSTASTSTPTPNASQSGVSNGKNYDVAMTPIDGATSDAVGHWHAQAGQLSGGDPAVVEAFNKASVASARQQIDQARSEAAGQSWNFDVKSAVTFRPTAITELLTGVYYADGAAHPINYVSTVVIDSHTAQPITLKDLFVNEQSGLNRLSEQTKAIWPKVYGAGDGPMPDEPGNRPLEQNFANWIPTPAGVEIHFNDGQLGHGLPVITVPWSALSDVLAPNMIELSRG